MAKLTEREILKEAMFLAGWARVKPISKLPDSTFHSKGNFMTKIAPDMSQALRDAGFAIGTETRFTMDKVAVKAAEKAALKSGLLVKGAY